MQLVNSRIIGEPANWLIVTLTLVFVAFGAFTIAKHAEMIVSPSDKT